MVFRVFTLSGSILEVANWFLFSENCMDSLLELSGSTKRNMNSGSDTRNSTFSCSVFGRFPGS